MRLRAVLCETERRSVAQLHVAQALAASTGQVFWDMDGLRAAREGVRKPLDTAVLNEATVAVVLECELERPAWYLFVSRLAVAPTITHGDAEITSDATCSYCNVLPFLPALVSSPAVPPVHAALLGLPPQAVLSDLVREPLSARGTLPCRQDNQQDDYSNVRRCEVHGCPLQYTIHSVSANTSYVYGCLTGLSHTAYIHARHLQLWSVINRKSY